QNEARDENTDACFHPTIHGAEGCTRRTANLRGKTGCRKGARSLTARSAVGDRPEKPFGNAGFPVAAGLRPSGAAAHSAPVTPHRSGGIRTAQADSGTFR